MIQSLDLLSVWHRFFFVPEPASSIAVFRIIYGLIILIDTLYLLQIAQYCFGIYGSYPMDYWKISNHSLLRFSLFTWLPKNNVSIYLILYWLILSSFCLMIGYMTTIAAISTFICLVSLHHRNIYVYNSGDTLCRLMSFLLIFAESGKGLSVDNFICGYNQFNTMIIPWASKLIMLQMSIVYLWSAINKLTYGIDWRNGSAVYYALMNRSISKAIFSVKNLRVMPLASKILTWLTLFLEFFIGLGLWVEDLRYWAIGLGILFHLGIEINLIVGIFSWIMIAGLLLFLDPNLLSTFLSSYCKT